VGAVNEQKTDGEASECLYIPSWRNLKRGRRLERVTPDRLPWAGCHALCALFSCVVLVWNAISVLPGRSPLKERSCVDYLHAVSA
jgi:hypothetical protein